MRPLPSDRSFAAERADATAAGVFDTPERALLREQVRRFVAREVEPQAALWERAGSIPREVLRRLGALGWLGQMVPETHGGASADLYFVAARTRASTSRINALRGFCREFGMVIAQGSRLGVEQISGALADPHAAVTNADPTAR